MHTHVHSPLARGMHLALKNAKINDKFQDSLYVFLELVRAGVMHGNLWSNRPYSGGPSFGTGELFRLDWIQLGQRDVMRHRWSLGCG